MNAYSQQARVWPAFLCLLPLTMTLVLSLGLRQSMVSEIETLLVTAGVTYLVACFVRDRGQRLQETLFASWGGVPTTQMLQPSRKNESHALRRRLKVMARLSDEIADSDEGPTSEGKIVAYVAWLREMTRDRKKFPLVFSENVGYGFRRNLLGLRSPGIAISIVSALVAVAMAVASLASHHWSHFWTDTVIFVADLGALAIWLRLITPDWVRTQALNYANALFGAAERIEAARVGGQHAVKQRRSS